jgi:hypothetical protein
MKRVFLPQILLLLSFLFFLLGCSSQKTEAYYGFFGSSSVVLVIQGDHLVVMHIGPSLVEGYAEAEGLDRKAALEELVGIPAKGYFGTDESSLAEVRSLITTIAAESLGIARSEVTDELALSALHSKAGDLRKTPFVSTLKMLTGFPDGLALLQKMKACHTYDVGQFVGIDTETDWKLLKDYLG